MKKFLTGILCCTLCIALSTAVFANVNDLNKSGKNPENPTMLIEERINKGEAVFYNTPDIIYSTTSAENGLRDTYMYTEGKVTRFDKIDTFDIVYVETADGTLFFTKVPFYVEDKTWGRIEDGEEYGFFFYYQGYSTVLKAPNGVLCGIKVINEKPVKLETSKDIENYIIDKYTQFSYTAHKTDGLKTVETKHIVKIENVNVKWDSPDRISRISIRCDISLLRNLHHITGENKEIGRMAANNYMKIIADDLLSKLPPDINITTALFTYGWYTYPNIRQGRNDIYYSQWGAVDGKFQWSLGERSFMGE